VDSWSKIARRVRVPAGFVLAGLYLWLARPTTQSIVLGIPIVVLGLLLRGAASGELRKNEQLATTGPYAYTRNPLYLGSFIIAAGFTVAARSLWIALAMLVMFVLIYLPVIRDEESYLAENFPDFTDYARRVPRFIPTVRQRSRTPSSFRWELYRKHREYNAIIGTVVIVAALLAKLLWVAH
jgi:protein-S-isoprenylcysteine O-methyltransferase Ste14